MCNIRADRNATPTLHTETGIQISDRKSEGNHGTIKPKRDTIILAIQRLILAFFGECSRSWMRLKRHSAHTLRTCEWE